MTTFTFRRSRLALLALCVIRFAVARAPAQDVRVETQQQARARNENRLEEQPAPEDAGDSELGEIKIVSRAPRPKMFALSSLQTLNFSSNAFLVREGAESDFFWNGKVGGSFVPYATRNFTPRLSFSQDWFRYYRFSALDFDAQTLQLDLKYDLKRDDTWYVNGSYAVARLSSPDTGEFYRYGFLNGSITHLVQLRTAPINFVMSGGAYGRQGDPSSSDRVSGYLNIAANYNIGENVQLSGFTRPEFQHYTHDPSGSREDFNLTVGAMLSFRPNPYMALATAVSYIGNFSTVSERRYDLVTPSFVLAAQFEF